MIPIILFFYLLRFCWCQSPEVTYVVNMNSQMECCDDDSKEYVDTSGVVVGRYNETIAYMYGNIEFLKDMEDDTMIEVSLHKEASGKFELMFLHEICDLCAEVNGGLDSDYHSYLKYLGIPEECPFAADVYPIKNFIMDTEDMPVNANTVGNYQAYLKVYKNPERDCKIKELLYCLTLKIIIEMA